MKTFILDKKPYPKTGWDSLYLILKEESDFKMQDSPLFLLGAAYYDNNELDKAFDYLTKANNLFRGRCFVEEPPKYKELLKTWKKQGTVVAC